MKSEREIDDLIAKTTFKSIAVGGLGILGPGGVMAAVIMETGIIIDTVSKIKKIGERNRKNEDDVIVIE